jgi:hypothetical protein
MFGDEGKPHTDTRQAYATRVVVGRGAATRVVTELPYLALPQARGFLFIGEASVSVHEPSPKVAEGDEPQPPHDYDATALWTTSDRNQVDAVRAGLEAKLRAARAWGTESTVQIAYVTPVAMCTSVTETEWIGGALWFNGTTTMELTDAHRKPTPRRLAAYVADAQLLDFARLAVADRHGGDDPPRLGQIFDAGWGHFIDWRKDVHVCLAAKDGQAWITGAVVLPGNSARAYTFESPVAPAPISLAPSNAPAPLASPPPDGRRVVMSEWSPGPAARAWLDALGVK